MSRTRSESTQFFNRTRQSAEIERQIALLGTPLARPVVLEVTGLRGVGKSRFLRRTRERLAARADCPIIVWVSLEHEASMTAVGPLLEIRNHLPIDCPLFDTALLTYWAVSNQRRQRIGQDDRSSLPVRILRADAEVADDLLPPQFGSLVFGEIANGVALFRGYQAGEFIEIDLLRDQPNDLFERLPDYLGRDVKRRLGHSEESRVVFFYDGYEKQSVRTLAERAPWLRTLIATMHVGIHIIAAQEHLGWSESELRDLIEPIELGKLPDADCRKMIRRELGDLDRKTESRLVEASGSLPFYLRALIDVCRVDIERYGVTRISTLPPSLRAVVDQYLEHLGPPHSTVIPMLAAVQYFDRSLYGHLVHAADLPSDTTRMSDFVEWFFVEWFFVANLGGGLYKTHDLLTDAARSVQTDTTIPTLRNAAAHLYVRTGEPPAIGADHLPQMFRALIEGWQSTSGMSVDDVEQLIDIGYYLYDAGHWRGLVELPAASGGDSHPADVIAGYFAALAARRIDGPARGLDLLAALEPSQTVLGRHVASFEIERAYLREISGDYAYARAEFRRLNGEAVPFDPSRRDHVRARLYHADMLIMDGQFADANELLADAYELVRTRSSLDRPELLRHRGHAYRFSLEFRAAEDLYLRALGEARDSPSMKAKLRTNLAESRCWHDPHTAIDDARAAIDLNTRLSSRIEIAKAHAALGVALANNGEIDQARDACEVAISVSRQVDYPAGICFGLQARVVLEVRSRDPAAADRAYAELLDRLKGLGTYQHLSVVPAWMRGDEVEFQSRTGQIGWISGTSRRSHLDLIAGS